MRILTGLICATSLLVTAPAFAGGHSTWKSVPEESSIAFGSVKKDTVGEVHHFETVNGTVADSGEISITIDLASVETNIDIRNERIAKHVFQDGAATAVISGTIGMEEVNALKAGETAIVDIEAKLAFAGGETDIEAEMLVARLSENRVLVTTADFIMMPTADLGIDEGVNMLMKLAKLPGITRVTPVAVRLVFQK
ncbi:MAG: YceI family protein [Hyphomicrobiales bacterium]